MTATINKADSLKKPARKKKSFLHRHKYLILAFLIPFVIMGVAFAIAGIAPFGNKQILVVDLWHQYYPFLVTLQNKLQSGASMFWTWDVGMGTNFFALISYYLASPLNFLTVLVPQSILTEFLAFSVVFKIGIAGLCFAIFLRYTFKRNNWSLAMFSPMYALCSFIMGYYWNVIWLDTIAILPLVVTGTVALMREGKFRLYIISLALSILANYYIGLFTCIFVLLCYIGYNICMWDGFKNFLKRFLRIGVCTLVALSITALLTLPAFFALQNTYSTTSTFPKTYAINIGGSNDLNGTLIAIQKVISNSIAFVEPTSKEGLPNIYCTYAAVFLGILSCLSAKIKRREKVFNLFMLAFFVMSFIIRQLDYIWHGFHFTNMLPYRFSFLFSFVLITMAFRAYSNIAFFNKWDVLLAGILSLIPIILAIGIQDAMPIVLTSVILLCVFLVTFLFSTRKVNRKMLNIFLSVVLAVEFISSAAFGLSAVGVTTKSGYPREGESVSALLGTIDSLQEGKNEFYRVEMTTTQTLNDGALNGYNGISVFNSMANVNISSFAENTGLTGRKSGNRYSYRESSPVTNLLFNLKYMIARDGKYNNTIYMKEIAQDGNVKLLENTAYLPIGFMADEDMLKYEVDKTVDNPIANQNEIFSYATGLDEDVFTILKVVNQGHTDYAVFPVNKTSDYKYTFSTNNDSVEPHLKYNYEMPEDGMVCFFVNVTNGENLTLYVNDEAQSTFDVSKAYIACGGVYNKGDKISLYMDLEAGAKGTATVVCAYFNQDVFEKGYEILSKNTLTTTAYTDSSIEGTITADKDGLLYTSIPYEEGWRAWVDGEEVEITPVGDAMLAFKLSAGTHTVKISFIPKGFWLGLAMFSGGILVFAVMCLVSWRSNKKKRMASGKKKKRRSFRGEKIGYPDDVWAVQEQEEREKARLEEERLKAKKKKEQQAEEQAFDYENSRLKNSDDYIPGQEEMSETTKRVLEQEEAILKDTLNKDPLNGGNNTKPEDKA